MASSLIGIPEYFTWFIDRNIDLTKIPEICCPFREEDTLSFSHSPEKGLWRCFDACKIDGDVTTLHQKSYRLRSRRKAEDPLYKLLGLRTEGFRQQAERGAADEHAAAFKTVHAKAAMVACTVEDRDELDYIMSRYPPETNRLEVSYNCKRF